MPTKEETLAWNQMVIADHRANSGTLTQGPMAGAQLLLLTSIGAKSGESRTQPLAFVRDGDAYIIVGSNAGQEIQPAWLTNIGKTPAVTCEVGPETFQATAQVLAGDERRRAFDAVIAAMPAFADYEKSIQTREIPVVRLTPVA